MHTLGGRADDDDGFSFFHSRCVWDFFPFQLDFFLFFFNSSSTFVRDTCARTRIIERYRLGFSFDLFGTAFNWTTTAHTAAAAKMPPVIGSLVVLITRAH